MAGLLQNHIAVVTGRFLYWPRHRAWLFAEGVLVAALDINGETAAKIG